MEIVATGLRFPEGPVAMADGSIILVEIEAGRITRVRPDGSKETVAEPGGGPNGLAIGPEGKLYCCNNGGFNYVEANGMLAPHGIASDYSGGRIERIDIATGAVEIPTSPAISVAYCAAPTTSYSMARAVSGSPTTARSTMRSAATTWSASSTARLMAATSRK